MAKTSMRPSAVRWLVSLESVGPPVGSQSDQLVGLVWYLWKTPTGPEAKTSSRPSWLWSTVRSCPPPPKVCQVDQPPLVVVW